ncbi:MAG: SMC-Scp complex subunit ScpB [Tepidibacter sp.]|jgi:segregation and condensation protein B|uniref:SMC-Scp complex subunit ScpB n=1 Tax=Tepidibacter sp. TaxID=2529387 RepID=UPI0025E59131|nr:SMC-Scp complex subunit ScpB [Tepidibacter sp.]MCT4509742.1 SMC-Scp complex subunit ScpB [Tepidibacter sp.]
MNNKRIKHIIESVLFSYSDPITVREIKEIINEDTSSNDIEKILIEMQREYEEQNRGIQIYKVQNKYQMGTNKEYQEYVRKLFEPKKKKSLTQATLETLTIIAYKQPITKVEIEEIRGVKCDKAISTLVEHGFVKEAGRLNKIGKPIIYKTTEEFLKLFGLDKIEDLPPVQEEKQE